MTSTTCSPSPSDYDDDEQGGADDNVTTTTTAATTTTTTTATANSGEESNNAILTTTMRPLHVVFLHLDLGIGGAEQLVTQLAIASHELGHTVDVVTTRCDPDHCFSQYKPPDGALCANLHVCGGWIPADVFGRCRTFMSTIRLLYLAVRVAFTATASTRRKRRPDNNNKSSQLLLSRPDLYVVDVLPAPLLVLNNFTDAATLFYCHFPDKLLKRNSGGTTAAAPGGRFAPLLTRLYRSVMDNVEGRAMNLADTVVVNSLFTRRTVLRSFASCWQKNNEQARAEGDNNDATEGERGEGEEFLPVLYPALDGTSLDEYRTTRNNEKKDGGSSSSSKSDEPTSTTIRKEYAIVSLNRYERKKNLELFLEAAAWVREHHPSIEMPKLVVAGGYDTQNIENVEYLVELKQLAKKLNLSDNIDFKLSISDNERSRLLHTALAVVYTPSNEHFGIVPIEAMYASTPVIAVNNGGPTESVVDGVTGYLRDSTPSDFGRAVVDLLTEYPTKSVRMGVEGRQHVISKFGELRLKQEWKDLTERTLLKGRRRLANSRFHVYRLARIVTYSFEALWTLAVALTVTWLLHQLLVVLGIIDKESSSSIWDFIREMVASARQSSSSTTTPTSGDGDDNTNNEL